MSIDFCDLTSEPCTHRNTEYDYVLIVLCRLPFGLKFLERVVQFARLPQTIFTDHDHLINAKFFSTLCSQAGIDVKNSRIYRPRSNSRAEGAVQTVIAALHIFLMQTKKKNCVQLLPLAAWTSNDIPGVVSGYSAYYLMYGRNTIGIGDCDPVIPEHGSVAVCVFVKQMIADRRFFQEKLHTQHDKVGNQFFQKHSTHVYEPGDKVRYKGQTKDQNSNLHRVSTGGHTVQNKPTTFRS